MKLKLKHDIPYFNQKIPYQFDHAGFGSWGITNAELKLISPSKYFKDIVELVGTHTEMDAIPQDEGIIENMKDEIENGERQWKYDLPFILIDTSKEKLSGQDGRHRMAVMEKLGIELVPCLYLYKTKNKKRDMHDSKLLLDSPEAYFLTEMTSANNGRDSKGYYVATNVVAARTGTQQYRGSEIGVNDPKMLNDIFYLERPASEVFSKDTMASFNGAAFTDGHPVEKRVTSKNSKYLSKGIVTNPRKADFLDDDGNELLLVDVIVQDEDTIKEIENGKIQVSAGYSWDYKVIDIATRRLKVTNIRANHLALVDRGRAGSAMILDEDIDFVKEIILDNEIVKEIALDEGGENMEGTVYKFSHPSLKDKEIHVRGFDNEKEAEEAAKQYLQDSEKEEE